MNSVQGTYSWSLTSSVMTLSRVERTAGDRKLMAAHLALMIWEKSGFIKVTILNDSRTLMGIAAEGEGGWADESAVMNIPTVFRTGIYKQI